MDDLSEIEQLANDLRDAVPEWPAVDFLCKQNHWFAYTRIGDTIFGASPFGSKDDAARSIERDVDQWIRRQ